MSPAGGKRYEQAPCQYGATPESEHLYHWYERIMVTGSGNQDSDDPSSPIYRTADHAFRNAKPPIKYRDNCRGLSLAPPECLGPYFALGVAAPGAIHVGVSAHSTAGLSGSSAVARASRTKLQFSMSRVMIFGLPIQRQMVEAPPVRAKLPRVQKKFAELRKI